VVPGEEDAAVAAILARATPLDVRLPVRLHGVALPAALAAPPLLPVLPGEVLLDPSQIPQSSAQQSVGSVPFHAGIELASRIVQDACVHMHRSLPRRVVVHARWLGADVHALARRRRRGRVTTLPAAAGAGREAAALAELPGEVVAPAVQLQVLVPLEPLVADLAHEPVRRHQRARRQRDHLSAGVFVMLICASIGVRRRD